MIILDLEVIDFKFGSLKITTSKTSFKTAILRNIKEVEYIIRKMSIRLMADSKGR